MCAQLRTFLLFAVALTVAAHPLVRSLSSSLLLANEFGPEVQVVICTSHGPVVLDDPSGMPEPSKQDAACPWCAVECGVAGKLVAIAAVQIGTLEPPSFCRATTRAFNSDCDRLLLIGQPTHLAGHLR